MGCVLAKYQRVQQLSVPELTLKICSLRNRLFRNPVHGCSRVNVECFLYARRIALYPCKHYKKGVVMIGYRPKQLLNTQKHACTILSLCSVNCRERHRSLPQGTYLQYKYKQYLYKLYTLKRISNWSPSLCYILGKVFAEK